MHPSGAMRVEGGQQRGFPDQVTGLRGAVGGRVSSSLSRPTTVRCRSRMWRRRRTPCGSTPVAR
ncbi:MAG TPA: hypothetical protein VIL00_00065 [Pseudonocardiaceae bacterium]